MELLEIMKKIRSIRKYTGEAIPDEKLQKILEAGLLSPSSRGRRPWELIVVRDKDTLKKMSECRVGSAKMLENAAAAIVVVADEEKTDVWAEDCSIVMSNMHLMADSLGVGSCWIQGRLRNAPDGRSAEEYLRDILGYPEKIRLEAILSLGIPAVHPEGHSLEDIPGNKVHYEKYGNTEV